MRFINWLWPMYLVTIAFQAYANDVVVTHQTESHWYQYAQHELAQKPRFRPNAKAKNVILFVGDGMGIGTVTAARILAGQNKGQSGEENRLSFEYFPFTGLSKTYNVDAQTPDSAGTMTAIITGVKTNAGLIGVDEHVKRGVCEGQEGHELVTTLEMAELQGKSTGIVTTARVTHATPAATYAKSADRDWEDISDLPKKAIEQGCKDIALQLIEFESKLKQRFPSQADRINGIEVVFGGGRRHFLPKAVSFNSEDASSPIEGDRTDGRDLISEWKHLYPKGRYVDSLTAFREIDLKSTDQVFGLFNESHMHYESDRHTDKLGEPSLTEMTASAMTLLAKNQQGYFLMVESGRIDHGHHAGNAYNALHDTIELAEAVDYAVNHTNPDETLIMVTADHSHVFTLAGYPKRGNPILGKVISVGSDQPKLAADGLPYTTIGYMNGRGFHDFDDETDADSVYDAEITEGRSDLSSIDTQRPGFHQEAHVPLESETHSAEDVSIYARGVGAELVSGVNEQNLIFHIFKEVLK